MKILLNNLYKIESHFSHIVSIDSCNYGVITDSGWSPGGVVSAVTVGFNKHIFTASFDTGADIAQLFKRIVFIRLKHRYLAFINITGLRQVFWAEKNLHNALPLVHRVGF